MGSPDFLENAVRKNRKNMKRYGQVIGVNPEKLEEYKKLHAAAWPGVLKMIKDGTVDDLGVDLHGQVIFHTAVSPAGVGPTSSNKLEIESSIAPLSAAGVKLHLGKGKLKQETVDALEANNAVYAVIPPVTALLEAHTLEKKVLAFPELGMEALHLIRVDRYPAIIGAAHGRSIYE